jgi:hypothetical protein
LRADGSRWLRYLRRQALIESDWEAGIHVAEAVERGRGVTVTKDMLAASQAARPRARRKDKRTQTIVTIVAGAALLTAWLFGYLQAGSDIAPSVSNVLPGATHIEQRGDVFFGYAEQGNPTSGQLIGYAGTGTATGYAGPIEVLVGVNADGAIIGVEIIEHRETPGFFRRLLEADFFRQFLGMDYTNELRLGQDIDAVTGATISSEAVARAVREQARALAAGPIGARVPAAVEPIQFGAPEALLLALYIVAYFGHRSRQPQAKKWIRRLTLVGGVIGIGFLYNKPLTVAHFISLLSGYWPDWHSNLYWFLLLGGLLFVTTAQGKNPYCSWFCPFGAVQEGLGKIGGAKLFRPRQWHSRLQWLQRGLALSAILLGLALRQPGPASYEPFGTLFDFTGGTAQWILLAIIMLTSLVVLRPFCNYLCPIDPIVDYIGEGRRIVDTTIKKVRS